MKYNLLNRIWVLTGSSLWLGMTLAGVAQAQSPLELAESSSTGRNVLRADWLTPLGANLIHNFFNNKELLFPVLISYERGIAKRWSIGAEALVNGGYPDDRRNGFSAMPRYYALIIKNSETPLTGLYISPALGYLVLRVKDKYLATAVSAERLKTGMLVGWQNGIKGTAPRFVFDFGMGAAYWSEIGNDPTEAYPSAFGNDYDLLELRVRFEVRAGIGYQF